MSMRAIGEGTFKCEKCGIEARATGPLIAWSKTLSEEEVRREMLKGDILSSESQRGGREDSGSAREVDFQPFELTDVFGFDCLYPSKTFLEFKAPARGKDVRWTTFGFEGFLSVIFEAKREEVEIVEVSKDKYSVYIVIVIKNTRWLG
jgi:hypothetical protein